MAATQSAAVASNTCVAPSARAISSFAGEMSTATFSSDAYNIYVTAAEADGQTSLIYAIENL